MPSCRSSYTTSLSRFSLLGLIFNLFQIEGCDVPSWRWLVVVGCNLSSCYGAVREHRPAPSQTPDQVLELLEVVVDTILSLHSVSHDNRSQAEVRQAREQQ